jgi:hypothetical protein
MDAVAAGFFTAAVAINGQLTIKKAVAHFLATAF